MNKQVRVHEAGGRSRFGPGLLAAVALLVLSVAGVAGATPDKPGDAKTTDPAAATGMEATVSSSAPALRRAAIRITVYTTSDWAQVSLPGISAGHVVVANPQARSVQPIAGGVIVHGVAGRFSGVTVDVVTEIDPAAKTVSVSVSQGAAGATRVDVQNRTTTTYPVVSVLGAPGTTVSVPVSADQLMGPTQLEWARADDERRVLAFTYPWFDGDTTTDPTLSDHPTDVWRSWSATDALAMAQKARAAGIDGFVMSFAGGARNGLALHQALEAARQTNGTATILLETKEAGSAAVAEQWLTEALRQADSPAFMRLDGVPVVFAYESGRVPAATWKAITDRLAAAGTPVKVIGDASWDDTAGVMTGQYRYNSLFRSPNVPMSTTELTLLDQAMSRGMRAKATLGVGTPGLMVATVQPGWDDRPLRGANRVAIDWNGTSTYDATWQASLASEPDWVVITSWNEWYEGTGIAPSVEHGTTGLDATRTWAERFHG